MSHISVGFINWWPVTKYKYVKIVIMSEISLSREEARSWCITSKQNKQFSLRILVNIFKKYGPLVILLQEQLAVFGGKKKNNGWQVWGTAATAPLRPKYYRKCVLRVHIWHSQRSWCRFHVKSKKRKNSKFLPLGHISSSLSFIVSKLR